MKNSFVILLLLLITSCNSSRYCYIVRHAEKQDNTPYSVLSEAGHKRALLLRDSLIDKKIDIIYATPFQRTQETARPLSEALHKPLSIYRNNAHDSIATVIRNSKHNILLVGHSGNIPSIILGITGQKVSPIGESEYDNIYIIKTKKGTRTLIQKKYATSQK